MQPGQNPEAISVAVVLSKQPEEMKIKAYTIDLSEQMAVCDANYIRLLKLLGNTRTLTRRMVSLPYPGEKGLSEQVCVCLEVLEEFKYTSTISIRQQLKGNESLPDHYTSPEMIVRVYHDAKTAEVTSYQHHRYFKAIYPVPNQFMYQSDEKEQLNLFLSEWLTLCIEEGLSTAEDLPLDKLSCL